MHADHRVGRARFAWRAWAVVALLCLLAAPASHAAEPFFFIQATDPQFGMYAENRDFSQECANFEFFVATANRLKPKFVVVTGDLIHKTGDAAQIAEYLRIAGKLDPAIRLYNVAGNHDVGDPTPESLALYRKHFGPDRFSFRVADTAFVAINSSLIQSPGKAPAEREAQDRWLREELSKLKAAGAKRIVVFQHHPPFLMHPGEPNEYFNLPVEGRGRDIDLYAKSGVSHVFAGHYHLSNTARYKGIEFVVTGPLGKPRGSERSGFRVVKVTDSGVEHEYIDLGSIPNRIAPATEPAVRKSK